MTEEQKDQPVTGNQGGQQNQGGQFNRDNQRKDDGPTEKASTAVEEDEEQPEIPNEYPDKNQQNGDKAPADERNHKEEHQQGSQRESTVRDANKNERSNQGGIQNKNQNGNQGSADKKN